MPDNEDFQIGVTADIEQAGRNFDALDARIAQSARQGVEHLGLLDRAVGGIGAGVLAIGGRFTPVIAGVTALIGVVREAEERARELGERAENIVPKLGGSIEEKFEGLSSALEELRAGIIATFWGSLTGAAESTGIGRALTWLIERATEAARALNSVVETALPPEQRSNAALDAQIKTLEERIAQLRSMTDEQARASRESALALAGPEGAAGIEEQTQALNNRAQAIAQNEAELARLRAVLEGRPHPFGHLELSEIDQQIEALKKRNLQLRLDVETFHMAADAAARYRAEQMAIAAAGGEDRFQRLSQDQQQRLRTQIDESARLSAQFRELQQGQRSGQSRDRIFGAAETQINQLELQTRALTQTAGQAARLREEERLLGQLRQARRPIDDATRQRAEDLAERYGEATQRLKDMQRQMAAVAEFGRTMSSALERAFGDWISGTETDWRRLFSTLMRDLAVLALRQNVLQPLFGGGNVQGGGLLGQLVSGLMPGAGVPGRASGGPVSAGQMYMVGEHGPEPFIPAMDGVILPHGSMGGGTTINMRIDLAGANGDEAIARISGQAARAAAMQAVEASNEAYPARQRRLNLLGS